MGIAMTERQRQGTTQSSRGSILSQRIVGCYYYISLFRFASCMGKRGALSVRCLACGSGMAAQNAPRRETPLQLMSGKLGSRTTRTRTGDSLTDVWMTVSSGTSVVSSSTTTELGSRSGFFQYLVPSLSMWRNLQCWPCLHPERLVE